MKALHVRLLAVSLILLLLLSSVAAMGLRPWSVAYAAGTISGTVFADYDSDGFRDPNEPGLGGITVTAYDSAGDVQGTTTSFATICVGAGTPIAACTGPNTPALGSYSLNATGTGPYRIEFSGWPTYLQPARHGTGNGTSVQFVPDGNSANINFGLHNPAEYCQNNPNIASSCYSNGDPLLAPTGAFPAADRPALVEIPFVPPNTGPGSNNYLATGAQIGAIWGLTYQRSSQTLLAAAVVRRHSGFGPGGIGAIYTVDPSGVNSPSVLINLNTAGYPVGTGVGTLPPRNLTADSAAPNRDPDAFDAVGKLGIGGISLSEDEETLWVMNLTTRSLLEIRVGVPATTPTAADITVHAVPNPSCTSGEFRPWAVKTYRGQVYIGGVCSGELPYTGKNTNTSHLRAYIYRHDPTGAVGNFDLVYDFPLDYPRGLLSQQGGNQPSAAWLPWINEWGDINAPMPLPGGGPFTQTMYPQPMLTAIEFDADGAMVLGLLDRAGMQLGNRNYSTLAADTGTYEGVAGGDTLRLCVNPAGGYVLESNGACAATGLTGTGVGNNQGPGGGEFFGMDAYGGTHQEVTLGGLALHPGRREVVSTAYDPNDPGPFRSGGFRWFDTTNGTRPRTYLVFGQDVVIGTGTAQQPSSMGKAAGLGDVELLCDQAPIQIGNRVWRDDNGNGIQDPGEPPLAGVEVELWRDGTRIGVATTDVNGEYYFISGQNATDADLNDNIIHDGGIGIRPRTGTPGGDSDYEIRIPNAVGATQQAPLAGMAVTQANADPSPNGTSRDSNGTLNGTNAVYRIPYANLAGAGYNNHTYDFGFTPPFSVGNRVWYDVNNNGLDDDGPGTGINGVTVRLYADTNGNGILDTGDLLMDTVVTSSGGYYLFTNLPPGDYLVHLPAANFAAGGPLEGYTSSTGQWGSATGPYEGPASPDPNNNVDQDDNGNIGSGGLTTPGLTGGIISQVITLGPGANEPLNEPSGPNTPGFPDTTPDNRSNLTLDFGVFQPASIGDFIWNDANNNGIQDAGEPGISGVTVNLYDASGTTLIATTTTDANGFYRFINLPPTTAYVIRLDNPADYTGTGPLVGYQLSPANQGGDDTVDSDATLPTPADPIGPGNYPQMAATTGAAGSNTPTYDAGFFQPLSLGNRVWHDLNNDGLDNDGLGTGIGGVTVNLLDSTGTTIIATTTTTAQGYYLFTNLQPGAYIVELAAANFTGTGPLVGYTSSTGQWASATGPYEPGASGITDGDDNGTVVGTLGTGGSIRSTPVTLASGAAPTGEPATPGLPDAALDNNSNLTIDFGVFQPASIGDFVWYDIDGDGIQDAGELGIPSVTVNLYDASGTTLIATTTTDANGFYRFINLQPTTDYVIRLDNPDDYTGTGPLVGLYPSPSEQGTNNTVDSNAVLPTPGAAIGTDNYPQMAAPTGAPGSYIPTYDAGFFRLLSLGDLVWHDTNNNGRVDPGESGIDGVVVQLYRDTNGSGVFDTGDQFIAETVTSDGGLYRFDGLLPGDYLVVLPAGNFSGTGVLVGYTSSTGDNSEPAPSPNNDVNNDDNGTVIGTLGANGVIASSAVTLTPNAEPTDDGDSDPNTNLTVDFGVFVLSSLGDRVWFDTNRNGIQDAGEAGVPGVTVTLYRANGAQVATMTTDGNGTYGFTGLQPGEYYLVFSNLPPGYAFTEPNQGGDTTRDSDADPSNGRTATITLGPEQHDSTWDAGIYQLAGLGDYVWEDLNRNGIQDTDEPPVSGVKVILRDGNGTLIHETTTNDQGYYFFGDLVPGSYQVEFEPPSGYRFTLPNQGADRARDSNVDPTTGRTEIIDLAVGESNPTIDAGLYRPASLGDRVWLDSNGNGIQDNGEPGVPDVTVRLLDGNGDPVRNPDGTPRTVITDAEGRYQFTDLTPGLPYQVEFVLPDGYAFTLPDRGIDDTRDSDADPSNGRTSIIRLRSGENNLTIDAGLYRLLSLGDLVWLDANNNGVVDAGEQGVRGVTVRLYRATNGQPVGDPIAETTTDSNGNYLFTGLTAGDYIVEILPPAGYRSSTGRNGQDSGPYEPGIDGNSDRNNADHGTEVQSGLIHSSTVTLTPGGEPTNDGDNDPNTNLTIDFGIFQPASLGSVVWRDLNNNGQRDPGEPGIADVTVTLYDEQGNIVATTTTDADGRYLFTHLTPGTYQLGFTLLDGYFFTWQGRGDPTTDSDVDPVTGRTGSITIGAGENILTIWAGMTTTQPTAITLNRFTATREDGRVVIRWETGVERNTWGYQLYRGTGDDRALATRITPTIILARGRGANGAAYSWNDSTATDDGDYRYWLEEVEVDGTTSIHGPIRINAQTASNTFKVFLPLTVR